MCCNTVILPSCIRESRGDALPSLPSSSSADSQSITAADAQLVATVDDLFGLKYRAVMSALSGPNKGECRDRESRSFQVDLQYPQKEKGDKRGSGSTPGSAGTSPVKPSTTTWRSASPAVGPGTHRQQGGV